MQIFGMFSFIEFHPTNLFIFRKIFNQIAASSFDYSGYYLIVLTPLTSKSAQYEMASKILQDCWSKAIINVNLLMQDLQSTPIMYTYFPFAESHCEQVIPVVLRRFTGNESPPQLFVNKVKNMHKCKVRTIISGFQPFLMFSFNELGEYSAGGVDVNFLRSLSERMNFTSYIRHRSRINSSHAILQSVRQL